MPPEMEAAAETKTKELEDSINAEGDDKVEGGGSGFAGGGGRSGPRMQVCYICGREFGSTSLGIHEKQCAKKWQDAEARKPAHERKPLPQRPDVQDGATLEDRNVAARAVHEGEVMAQCPWCGRSFKDHDTLLRHQRGCHGASVPKSGGGTTSCENSIEDMEALISNLFTIIDADGNGVIDETEIEVALRAFGRVGEALGFQVDYSFASMDTDLSGGVDPAEFLRALLPMEEIFGLRKCNQVFGALIHEAKADLDAGAPSKKHARWVGHRERITEHASVPKDVKPCPNCGRKFSPESMVIHLRSCGGDHGTSKLARANLEGSTRKERDAAEAVHSLLQLSARDPKLSAKMRAAFTRMDVNGNGTLERGELEIVYKSAKLSPSQPSLDDLIARYDANHDEKIQFSEFERLMRWVLSKA